MPREVWVRSQGKQKEDLPSKCCSRMPKDLSGAQKTVPMLQSSEIAKHTKVSKVAHQNLFPESECQDDTSIRKKKDHMKDHPRPPSPVVYRACVS